MNIILLRWSAIAFAIGLLTVLSFGCAVMPGGGYDGGNYYEPFGGSYGGWGSGYHVGPYRGNNRSMPSIPSWGGGGHGGGGEHGGGGGGHGR